MKMSIATISLSGDLVEKLEAAASAGFAGVEVFDNDLLSFSGTAADARRIAADLGLEIVSFQPFRDFEGMPPAKRERVFARAERKFDIMQELGCDLLVVGSNTAPDSVDDVVRAASDLRELGERASARGVRVGFKALAWARHIKTYRDAWEAVRGADHKAIGLILDSFHTFAGQADLTGLRAIPGSCIFLAHLADATAIASDLLARNRHFRTSPVRESCPFLSSWRRCRPPGSAAPCRWKFSMTRCVRARRDRPRSTGDVRCCSCSTSCASARRVRRQRCLCCRGAANAWARSSSSSPSMKGAPSISRRCLPASGLRAPACTSRNR